METRIAKIISYIFHPLFMPTLGIFILLNLETYLKYTIVPSGKIAIYSIVFINTGIVPAILAFFQYRFKFIKTLQMESKEERIFPFLATIFFYFFCFYILKKNNLPAPVYMLMFGAAVLVSVVFLINFFWKISVHATGAGGIIGMLWGISQKLNLEIMPVIFLFILFGGFIGFARLKLNAHNPSQIYAGFLLGFFSLLLFI